MKLSEAIREGAKLRPQFFGGYYYNRKAADKTLMESCALGAAVEAERGTLNEYTTIFVTSDFPILVEPAVERCPACEGGDGPFNCNLFGLIPHLNDDHKWSRELIADWVEKIEDEHAINEKVRHYQEEVRKREVSREELADMERDILGLRPYQREEPVETEETGVCPF